MLTMSPVRVCGVCLCSSILLLVSQLLGLPISPAANVQQSLPSLQADLACPGNFRYVELAQSPLQCCGLHRSNFT